MSRQIRLWMGAVLGMAAAATPLLAVAEDDGPVIRPRPAEIRPLAPRSLLLDVVNTGQRLVAVGDRGHILLSANGNDWAQVEVPVRSALTTVAFADDGQHGWAAGHDAAILRTTDGGKSWALQFFDPELERPFLDLEVFDKDRAVAVGAYGMMMRTEDGGATWDEIEADEVREDEVHINAITRLGNGALFLAGETGLMAVSGDEGQSWTRLESPYENSFFGALPAGEQGVLVYGLRGTLYLHDDPAGAADAEGWAVLENDNVATMFGGTRLNDGRIALVGLNGTVTLIAGEALHFFKTARGTPLSGVIEFGDGLLLVGESGVQRSALQH